MNLSDRKVDLKTLVHVIVFLLTTSGAFYGGLYARDVKLRTLEIQQKVLSDSISQLALAEASLASEMGKLRIEVESLRAYYKGRDDAAGRGKR